jgi:hypothetical protein
MPSSAVSSEMLPSNPLATQSRPLSYHWDEWPPARVSRHAASEPAAPSPPLHQPLRQRRFAANRGGGGGIEHAPSDPSGLPGGSGAAPPASVSWAARISHCGRRPTCTCHPATAPPIVGGAATTACAAILTTALSDAGPPGDPASPRPCAYPIQHHPDPIGTPTDPAATTRAPRRRRWARLPASCRRPICRACWRRQRSPRCAPTSRQWARM